MYFPHYPQSQVRVWEPTDERLYASFRGKHIALKSRNLTSAIAEIEASAVSYGHGTVDIMACDTHCIRGAVTFLMDDVTIGFSE